MNPNFKLVSIGKFQVIEFTPWSQQNIKHGFIVNSPNMRGEFKESGLAEVAEEFGLQRIIVAKQVHGDNVLRMAEVGKCDGDAIFATNDELNDVGIGIFTADCLPILVKGAQHVAVIHAGWRGLAVGVIKRTIGKLRDLAEDKQFEFIIGPCAGPALYEVGSEVIEAIPGVAYASPGTKYFLDLPGTAAAQIQATLSDLTPVHWCGVCTISDTRFHSYRRQGDRAGRNLTFIAKN